MDPAKRRAAAVIVISSDSDSDVPAPPPSTPLGLEAGRLLGAASSAGRATLKPSIVPLPPSAPPRPAAARGPAKVALSLAAAPLEPRIYPAAAAASGGGAKGRALPTAVSGAGRALPPRSSFGDGSGSRIRQAALSANASGDAELWIDSAAPTDAEGLAVHKAKVREVETWLSAAAAARRPEAAASAGGGVPPRLLVLLGPPGTGKSTTGELAGPFLLRPWGGAFSALSSSAAALTLPGQ